MCIGIYQNSNKDIINYLEQGKKIGKKFAVWGAGKRGRAFALKFDPKAIFIEYIFDKNESKYGEVFYTGQHVVDYKEYAKNVDVVFIVMEGYCLETVAKLKNVNPFVEIVSINNWVLGQQNAEQQIKMAHEIPKKVRDANICALDILYNPKRDVIKHIESYVNSVDKIYVWDNSEKSNAYFFDGLPYKDKIIYIHDGKNYGVGVPVNEVAERALNDGYDWLLTFDQDSVAGSGMVIAMKEYVESQFLDEKAAIVAPFVCDPISSIEEANFQGETAPRVSYMQNVIQSGSLHKLCVLNKLRLRGDFFVDFEDIEYCYRALLSGFHIVRLNRVRLYHQQDMGEFEVKTLDNGLVFYYGKYNAARYYYIYRNLLYMIKFFAKPMPDIAKKFRVEADAVLLRVANDTDRKCHENAIACAKRDFEAGILGEWNGK